MIMGWGKNGKARNGGKGEFGDDGKAQKRECEKQPSGNSMVAGKEEPEREKEET
jgi:hypothetical protein